MRLARAAAAPGKAANKDEPVAQAPDRARASSLAFFVTAQSSLLVGDHRESLLLLLLQKLWCPQAYNCRVAVHVQFEVQSVPYRY